MVGQFRIELHRLQFEEYSSDNKELQELIRDKAYELSLLTFKVAPWRIGSEPYYPHQLTGAFEQAAAAGHDPVTALEIAKIAAKVGANPPHISEGLQRIGVRPQGEEWQKELRLHLCDAIFAQFQDDERRRGYKMTERRQSDINTQSKDLAEFCVEKDIHPMELINKIHDDPISEAKRQVLK
ncbi:hypothetical protein ACFL6C_01495 [Myxococcota bacterium]